MAGIQLPAIPVLGGGAAPMSAAAAAAAAAVTEASRDLLRAAGDNDQSKAKVALGKEADVNFAVR